MTIPPTIHVAQLQKVYIVPERESGLRAGLTFLVPVAFAVTVPTEALTGRLSWQTMLGAAALTTFLLVLARWV